MSFAKCDINCLPAVTWYLITLVSKSLSWESFVMTSLGTLANAASVGANKVNGPVNQYHAHWSVYEDRAPPPSFNRVALLTGIVMYAI